jgi:hypothetical protein
MAKPILPVKYTHAANAVFGSLCRTAADVRFIPVRTGTVLFYVLKTVFSPVQCKDYHYCSSVDHLYLFAYFIIISVCKKTPTSSLRSPQKCSFTPVNSAFFGFASLEFDVFFSQTRVFLQRLINVRFKKKA